MSVTDLIKPSIHRPQVVVVVFGAAFEVVQKGLYGVLLSLVFAHLPQNGVLLESLRARAELADVFAVCGHGRAGVIGGRTSMSSFHGKSASGCERAPLTVTACLFAGGAESSAIGRFRSSILTASSDGVATSLASSLIEQATAL